ERRQANPHVDVARVAVADQGTRDVVAVQDRGAHQLAGRGGGGGRPAGRRGRRRRTHEVRQRAGGQALRQRLGIDRGGRGRRRGRALGRRRAPGEAARGVAG